MHHLPDYKDLYLLPKDFIINTIFTGSKPILRMGKLENRAKRSELARISALI